MTARLSANAPVLQQWIEITELEIRRTCGRVRRVWFWAMLFPVIGIVALGLIHPVATWNVVFDNLGLLTLCGISGLLPRGDPLANYAEYTTAFASLTTGMLCTAAIARLVIPLMAPAIIPADRSSGRLDEYRISRIPTWMYLTSRIYAQVWPWIIVGLWTMGPAAIFALWDTHQPISILSVMAEYLLLLASICTLSIGVSTWFRHAGAARIVAMMSVWIHPVGAIIIYGDFINHERFFHVNPISFEAVFSSHQTYSMFHFAAVTAYNLLLILFGLGLGYWGLNRDRRPAMFNRRMREQEGE